MAGGGRFEVVAAACRRLESEPLWHASLGSKELFHSNLLGWAIERWPERGRRVLEPWLRPGPGDRDRVRREHRHLDLLVEFSGHDAVVVENKTFALPNETQLGEYACDVAATMIGRPVLLLLSLTDPGWRDGKLDQADGTWIYVSYRRLGERLRDAFAPADDFATEVVVHHAELMIELADLIDLVADVRCSDPVALPEPVHEQLKRSRIADAVGKARAHHIMRLIRQRLDERQVAPPAWPHEVGFTNGTPLLAAFWQAGKDRFVGWQYQNDQWRLAMILSDLGGSGRRKKREQLAMQCETYFDFSAVQQLLSTGNSSTPYANQGRLPFNRFDPAFVYRYRKVGTETPVSTIVELADHYSRHAADWAATSAWPS